MALIMTPEINRYLLTAAREGRRLSTIASYLGISKAQASRLMARYPIWAKMNAARRWSAAEVDYLVANYGKASWEDLTRYLPGRSRAAIRRKARTLNCLKRVTTDQTRLRIREEMTRPAQKPTHRRNCLTCGAPFKSEGAHNRMCNGCRAGDTNYVEYSLAV